MSAQARRPPRKQMFLTRTIRDADCMQLSGRGGGGIYVANLAQFVEIAHKCGGREVTEICLPPVKIANGTK